MRIPKSILAAGAVGLIYAGRTLIRNSRRTDFHGKVVLITGGARGLGLALARDFAREGARLAICSRTQSQLDIAEQELKGLGAEVIARAVDVMDEAAVRSFVAEVRKAWGPVDVLVNCAGVISSAPYSAMQKEDFAESLNTHFWGAYIFISAVLPQMRERKAGRIVNIASIGGKMAVPHMLPYSTGKFALVGYSEGLRAEVLQEGVYVTTVCPGLMLTGSHDNVPVKGGNNEAEYQGFKTLDALMGVAVEEASSQIVEACRYGEAELVFPFSARAAVVLKGLAPSALQEVLGLVARLLPGAKSGANIAQTGKELKSKAPLGLEDKLEQAKLANNEV